MKICFSCKKFYRIQIFKLFLVSDVLDLPKNFTLTKSEADVRFSNEKRSKEPTAPMYSIPHISIKYPKGKNYYFTKFSLEFFFSKCDKVYRFDHIYKGNI